MYNHKSSNSSPPSHSLFPQCHPWFQKWVYFLGIWWLSATSWSRWWLSATSWSRNHFWNDLFCFYSCGFDSVALRSTTIRIGSCGFTSTNAQHGATSLHCGQPQVFKSATYFHYFSVGRSKNLQSSNFRPEVVRYCISARTLRQSAKKIKNQNSAIKNLQSAIKNLQSAIKNLQSEFYNQFLTTFPLPISTLPSMAFQM